MTPTQAVHEIVRGWEQSDPDAIAAIFAEGGVFDDPLQPRRRTGPRDIREACAGGIAAIRDCHIAIHSLVVSGDTAFAEGKFCSVLAADGARFDFPFVMIVDMKDGKVTRLAEYFDTRPLRDGTSA
jgi:ketosteroid isomerase-like protein